MRLKVPTAFASRYAAGRIDRDGCIDAPANEVEGLVALGYTHVPGDSPGLIYCATANRPTANLQPGVEVFDTTLNKPIWRNKNNNGWVDATGTAA
jgi:hypothetical protein